MCGGVNISTSRKHLHQIRFATTFHAFLISNSVDTPLTIQPNDAAVRAKRVGYRMMSRFADAGDPAIDDATVFAAERGVRDLIADRYWIAMLRIFHRLYHEVMQGSDTPTFDTTDTPFKMDFPTASAVRDMNYYADLFEAYDPPRGHPGDYNMESFHRELTTSHGLVIDQQTFYQSSFKALMLQKINAFKAA